MDRLARRIDTDSDELQAEPVKFEVSDIPPKMRYKLAKDLCNCSSHIGDGYYDLPCPVHDKAEELNAEWLEWRKRGTAKLLKLAEALDW